MTFTAHAIVAGSIATKVSNPLLISTLAFGSHFLLDAIPHWDFGTDWRKRPKAMTAVLALGDTILAFALTYLLFRNSVHTPLLLLAVVCSLLPDWLNAPWYMFYAKHNKKGIRTHAGFWEKVSYTIHKALNTHHAKDSFPLGLITQVFIVGIIYLLFA